MSSKCLSKYHVRGLGMKELVQAGSQDPSFPVRMFQNIKKKNSSDGSGWFLKSHFCCLSRKGQIDLKYSKEKAWWRQHLGKFGTNKALPGELWPGKCHLKQFLTPCSPHWGVGNLKSVYGRPLSIPSQIPKLCGTDTSIRATPVNVALEEAGVLCDPHIPSWPPAPLFSDSLKTEI